MKNFDRITPLASLFFLIQTGVPPAQSVPVPSPNPNSAVPMVGKIAPEDPGVETTKPEKQEKRIYQSACPAVLSGLVEAKKLAPIKDEECGERSPLEVSDIAGIRLSTKAKLNCRMATSLATWVKEADAQSRASFGSGITGIHAGTSYQCRRRNNAPDGKISEHGFANAFDITGFELEDGRAISVLKDWGEPLLPKDGEESESNTTLETQPQKISAEGNFLREIRTLACAHFTTVLSPDSNPHHADHFHFDLGCHGKACTYRICE